MEWLRRRSIPDCGICDPTLAAPYTRLEFERLATYNGEVARGIVHTAEYDARMAEVQERYDRWFRDEAEAKGHIQVEVTR